MLPVITLRTPSFDKIPVCDGETDKQTDESCTDGQRATGNTASHANASISISSKTHWILPVYNCGICVSLKQFQLLRY